MEATVQFSSVQFSSVQFSSVSEFQSRGAGVRQEEIGKSENIFGDECEVTADIEDSVRATVNYCV
jgi:hypothetical protein